MGRRRAPRLNVEQVSVERRIWGVGWRFARGVRRFWAREVRGVFMRSGTRIMARRGQHNVNALTIASYNGEARQPANVTQWQTHNAETRHTLTRQQLRI